MKHFVLVLLAITAALSMTAQDSAGDYRSRATGFWDDPINWERYDGTAWQPAINFPTAADGDINIMWPNTITYRTTHPIDNVQILTGTLIAASDTFNIVNVPNQIGLIIGGTLQWNRGWTGNNAYWVITSGGIANMNFRSDGSFGNTWKVMEGGTINFQNVYGYLNACKITNEGGTINFVTGSAKSLKSTSTHKDSITTINNFFQGKINFNSKGFVLGGIGDSMQLTNRGNININSDVHYASSGAFTDTRTTTMSNNATLFVDGLFVEQLGRFFGTGTLNIKGIYRAERYTYLSEFVKVVVDGGTMTGNARIDILNTLHLTGDTVTLGGLQSPDSTSIYINYAAIASVGPNTVIRMVNASIDNSGTLAFDATNDDISVRLNRSKIRNYGQLSVKGPGSLFMTSELQPSLFVNSTGSIRISDSATLDLTSGSSPVNFDNTSGTLAGKGIMKFPQGYTEQGQKIFPNFLTLTGPAAPLKSYASIGIDGIAGNDSTSAYYGPVIYDGDVQLKGTITVKESYGDAPPGEYEIVRARNGKITGAFSETNLLPGFYLETRDSTLILIKNQCTTVWYRDEDNDNYGRDSDTIIACLKPTGYVIQRNDCNDNDPAINPGAIELPNGLDDNCDGHADEDLKLVFRSAVSGKWDEYSTWEVYTGSVWTPAGRVPEYNDSTVTISHIVESRSATYSPKLLVTTTGTLNITNGYLILCAEGNYTDGTVNLGDYGDLRYLRNAHLQYLVVRGKFNWTGGQLYTTIVNYGTSTVSGTATKGLHAIFYNRGKLNVNNTSWDKRNLAGYINNLGSNAHLTFNSANLSGFLYDADILNLDGARLTLIGNNTLGNLRNNSVVDGNGSATFYATEKLGKIEPGYTNSNGTAVPGVIGINVFTPYTEAIELKIDIPVSGLSGSIHDQFIYGNSLDISQTRLNVMIGATGGFAPDTLIRLVTGNITGEFAEAVIPDGYKLRKGIDFVVLERIEGVSVLNSESLRNTDRFEKAPFVPTLLQRSQQLKVQGLQKPAELVSMVDRNGRTVFSESNYQNNRNLQNLAPGIYFYRIVTREGKFYTGKIMVTD